MPSSSGLSRVRQAAAELDRLAADGAGDHGPFAFGVAGDVDPAAEGDGPGGEAFGERGFAGARSPATSMLGLVMTPCW